MKKQLLSMVFGLAAISAQAATPLWLRDVQVSPDGTAIAFGYKGDIYTVDSKGGKAVQITSNGAYDTDPLWTPDGKEIVARTNECAELRHTEPEKAYFHCHTDITIPYDELGEITALCGNGKEIAIIKNGRFVLPGTELLNKALEEN